jgi:hypothetical protein
VYNAHAIGNHVPVGVPSFFSHNLNGRLARLAASFEPRTNLLHPLFVTMLRVQRAAVNCRLIHRAYATASSPHALVFLEHRSGTIDSGSLSALTAATQLGGEVTGLIVGSSSEVEPLVEKAKK